ncbi:conserved hypothetical protein [Desulforapulum autotrophicum HRM2]|uniref:DUF1456 family protein n=1 Tax=Desulforapulum autotrophicum (strain ATCC 43914 / DSM 3382 / VKM B-1955 / HRM2) TaxID=177437 RepID=C0QHT7_DESAH|nr:DUF1456 family protein [Desulforapulum autotrophicum]ACN13645.1 conserved hypothetical protein [Desulforapulum autotrophicum HRM2]
MTNNDILRMFRYAMDISESKLVAIFGLAGETVDRDQIGAMLKKEDEQGFELLDDSSMTAFLNGLIVHERGEKSGSQGAVLQSPEFLTNNIILKKLRIALNFKEEDMMAVFKLAGKDVSKAMLSALFRKPGHKNYKECGDQFLRNFLKGLAMRYRG